MWPGDDNPDWWPPHVQAILAAIGQAMGDKRLYPETLESIPSGFGSILSGHQVIIEHVSGKELGSRKGQYRITVEGPAFAGQWGFRSGHLEKLSRAAANAKGQPEFQKGPVTMVRGEYPRTTLMRVVVAATLGLATGVASYFFMGALLPHSQVVVDPGEAGELVAGALKQLFGLIACWVAALLVFLIALAYLSRPSQNGEKSN